MTLDCHGLSPRTRDPRRCHRLVSIERAREISAIVSARRRTRQAGRDSRSFSRSVLQLDGENLNRLIELTERHRLRSPAVADPIGRLTRDFESIRDTGHSTFAAERTVHPLLARTRKGNQMPRQIAAVDRRYVGRIKRAQILSVIPVVEMPTKPRKPAHGRQRRLEPFSGFGGPYPTEIAGARRGQEIEPDVGRRCSMGKSWCGSS